MKNTKKTVARVIMTILCVLMIGMIFFNSALDAAESTDMSNPFVDGINRFLKSVHIDFTVTDKMVRKTAHFAEYAALGLLLSITV